MSDEPSPGVLKRFDGRGMNHRDYLTPEQANLLDLYGLELLEIQYAAQPCPPTLAEAVKQPYHKLARIARRDPVMHEPVWLGCDAPIEDWLAMLVDSGNVKHYQSVAGGKVFIVRKGER